MLLWVLLLGAAPPVAAEEALLLFSKRCRLPLEPQHIRRSVFEHLPSPKPWLERCSTEVGEEWHGGRCRDRLTQQLQARSLKQPEWPAWPHVNSSLGARLTVNLHGWHGAPLNDTLAIILVGAQ